MQYIIEQYGWDIDGSLKYFHLIDSKVFDTDKSIKTGDYSKNGSIFSIKKLE